MSDNLGDPIKGVLHSTDASAGVLVPFAKQGSVTAHTLNSDEYLEVNSAQVVVAVAGDVHVFISNSATPGNFKTIARGTVGTNGGIVRSVAPTTGAKGDKVYVVAPAGVVDVVFEGAVRRETNATRPIWRESLIPGR